MSFVQSSSFFNVLRDFSLLILSTMISSKWHRVVNMFFRELCFASMYRVFFTISFDVIFCVIWIFFCSIIFIVIFNIDFIWREEDYSMSIVSDRDKQFVAHFWKRLCNRLETKFKLFMSFHSKIDEQTKNVNEMLKRYFRVYVNYQQNDWIEYLVVAKFETNNHQSDFIDVVLFMIIKEYFLKSNLKSLKSFENKNISIQRRDMRLVDKIVEKLEALRNYLRDELVWFQAKQTEYANRDRHLVSKFRVDDNVMLDKRFIDITRSSHSFDFKNLKLFKIIRVIKNHHVYELKLSKSMFEIHFVFYLWLFYLDNNRSLREQHRKSLSSIIIFDVTHHEAIRVIQSRIWRVKKNQDFNLDLSKYLREILQYKIYYTNDDEYNQNLKWQNYIDVDDCSNLVVDFHHANLNELESHWRFKSSQNWESLKNVINNVMINVEESNWHIVATRIASSSSKSFLTNTL